MNDSSAGGAGNEDPPLLDQETLIDLPDKNTPMAAKDYPKRISAMFQPKVFVEVFRDGSMTLSWTWAGSLVPKAQDGPQSDHEAIVADYVDLLNQQRHGGNSYQTVRETGEEAQW